MNTEESTSDVINTAPTYLSDPQVQYLSQVLEEVRRGNLLIPRFQREFVWKSDQQLELLRSVRGSVSLIPCGPKERPDLPRSELSETPGQGSELSNQHDS